MPPFAKRTLKTTNLGNIYVLKSEVKDRLIGLNEFKSPGPDRVHPSVLKNCADSMSLPLSIIFNISMKSGQVPKEWLKAHVTPIFKNGSRL